MEELKRKFEQNPPFCWGKNIFLLSRTQKMCKYFYAHFWCQLSTYSTKFPSFHPFHSATFFFSSIFSLSFHSPIPISTFINSLFSSINFPHWHQPLLVVLIYFILHFLFQFLAINFAQINTPTSHFWASSTFFPIPFIFWLTLSSRVHLHFLLWELDCEGGTKQGQFSG